VDAPATGLAADLDRVELETVSLGATEVVADAAAIVAAIELAPALSVVQRAILDFERHWWRRPGAKEQAIRDSFEMSPTRYYQTLNALLDLPEALAYDPALVNRLQRLRGSTLRSQRLA
jgi:uncharacterized protein DUF3263